MSGEYDSGSWIWAAMNVDNGERGAVGVDIWVQREDWSICDASRKRVPVYGRAEQLARYTAIWCEDAVLVSGGGVVCSVA